MDGDIRSADSGTLRKLPELGGVEGCCLRMRVADLAAGVAVKVDVLVEVRAVAGLRPLDMHLLDQAAGCQVLQAIVNRGQRDAGRPVLNPVENVVGRRVIVRLGQNLEDFAPMGREPDIGTQDGQTAVEAGGL